MNIPETNHTDEQIPTISYTDYDIENQLFKETNKESVEETNKESVEEIIEEKTPLEEIIKEESIKEMPIEETIKKDIIKKKPIEEIIKKEIIKEMPLEETIKKEIIKESPLEEIIKEESIKEEIIKEEIIKETPLEESIKEEDSIKEDSNTYSNQKEYIIFKNQLHALKRNNIFILKESKENKRFLDLKYDDLNNTINMIQTSVIFFSTISGFLQATKEYFNTNTSIVSVSSITISTYISLILSISKFYKFDEQKERIHSLREKYATLHNKIEYRMDVLGPWTWKELWEYQNPIEKLQQWKTVVSEMDSEYVELIALKQQLCTEFEIIMDSKSRNQYYIKHRELNYNNRVRINQINQKELLLETSISDQQLYDPNAQHIISLPNEDLDNWDDNL